MTTRLIPILLATPLVAGEMTVESGPFRVEHQFNAIALPTEPALVALKAESWGEYVVESIVDHGSEVKQGDVLVAFERESYDRRLEDLERSLSQKKLALASAELGVAKLKQETELALESARRAKRNADEDLKYFREVGRPATEAELDQRLKGSQFRLDAEKEELKQLKQMYEEDDLTEETEEIILERQKQSVESAEFYLKETQRNIARTRKTSLPRQAEGLENAAATATIALEKAEQNLPRELESAELELKGTQAAYEREKLEVERLKKDGDLLEIKAASDGILFHGSLEDGRWVLGDLSKALIEGGKVPTKRVILSIAPSGAELPLHARLDPAVSRALHDGSAVSVSLPGHQHLGLVGTVSNLPGVKQADGKRPVSIQVEWPEDFMLPPASTLECVAVVYQNPGAISVPAKALQAAADGSWSVELKMAEGKTERRQVDRGHATKERVEITAGLEKGQVVVVPE
ncbi:MAG: hypothetical protein AAGI48_08040 [Verrucomicrobiota bacterium]